MPRKTSAAKKARLAAEKAKLDKEKDLQSLNEPLFDDKNEINKKNECESKEEESDSDSEYEDDFGELITEEIEEGIKNVLQAIKNDDASELLDPKTTFFKEPEVGCLEEEKSKKHKPVYLKDYHRENLLSEYAKKDEDVEIDGGKQPFASLQREERSKLMKEINDAIVAVPEDEKEFFTKIEKLPEQKATDSALPDPQVDAEKFLEEFIDKKAWIPKEGDKVVNLDDVSGIEDDEAFEDAVEEFETAYNFRYEDPNSAEIMSYARNQATLRRDATSSRRRNREEQKLTKIKEKKEKDKIIHKEKVKTINQLVDVLERVKKEYGAEIDSEMVEKLSDTLLKGEFDDNEWHKVTADLFNDKFYDRKDESTWDPEDGIVGEFYDQVGSYSGEEDEGQVGKRKKAKKLTKLSQKQEKKKIFNMAEQVVDQKKLLLLDKIEKERGRAETKDFEMKFRYRGVSPESFGLTTREIFEAEDTQLNELVGLKKFAPYRPKELRNRDKRKVMKSKRLREWKKKVFNNEAGLQGDELKISVNSVEKKRHR